MKNQFFKNRFFELFVTMVTAYFFVAPVTAVSASFNSLSVADTAYVTVGSAAHDEFPQNDESLPEDDEDEPASEASKTNSDSDDWEVLHFNVGASETAGKLTCAHKPFLYKSLQFRPPLRPPRFRT